MPTAAAHRSSEAALLDQLAGAFELGSEPVEVNAVRLEVGDSCPPEVFSFLLDQFSLGEQDLYRVDGPVNLHRLAVLDFLHSAKGRGGGFKFQAEPGSLCVGDVVAVASGGVAA